MYQLQRGVVSLVSTFTLHFNYDDYLMQVKGTAGDIPSESQIAGTIEMGSSKVPVRMPTALLRELLRMDGASTGWPMRLLSPELFSVEVGNAHYS